MPVDMQAVIQLITQLHLNESLNIKKSHEEIVTHAIYQKAVQDVLETLKGIENNTINIKEYLNHRR